jgi:hypothetical protein
VTGGRAANRRCAANAVCGKSAAWPETAASADMDTAGVETTSTAAHVEAAAASTTHVEAAASASTVKAAAATTAMEAATAASATVTATTTAAAARRQRGIRNDQRCSGDARQKRDSN